MVIVNNLLNIRIFHRSLACRSYKHLSVKKTNS